MDQELVDMLDEYLDGEENLPPELLLDPYHPQNDVYFENLRQVKRQILATGNLMTPARREAVRLHRAGKQPQAISALVNFGPSTIRKWLKEPECMRLRALMDHLQILNDGPNENHRKAILYRIGVDNEAKKPRVTIAALQEINRMSGSYADSMGGSGNVVNIQINGELLPRGKLDQLPSTYETKAIEHNDAS